MAARTCLLCGKPLSRIWAGTGEDFCSREHRNQYRLRRGMERLSEANQIATVMRRREQPKQISLKELRAPGQVARRGFSDPAPAPLPVITAPPLRLESPARLLPATGFMAPRARAGESGLSRAAAAVAISMRPVAAPRPSAWLKTHIHSAPPLPARQATNGEMLCRPASVKWTGRVLPMTVRMEPRQQRMEFPVRAAKAPLCRGRALRVSMGKAFRLPESMAPPILYTPPRTNDLPRPEAKMLVAILPPARRERTAAAIPADPPEMLVPPPPPPEFERRFRWPEALEMTLHFRNTANGHRTSAVPFGSPDEAQSKERK